MRGQKWRKKITNDVSNKKIGFGAEQNQGFIFNRTDEKPVEISMMSKRKMADKILDEVLKLRQKKKKKNAKRLPKTLD